jgi:hypothetical protein
MAFAGLWETWRWPASERVRSLAIIITEPNALYDALHIPDAGILLLPQIDPGGCVIARLFAASHITIDFGPRSGGQQWTGSAADG